jgi:hypothetical protein
MSEPLLFSGLDGSNPLAFLSLLGVGLLSQHFCPEARISWVQAEGAWHPRLHGYDGDADRFLKNLHETLIASSSKPFEIDKKLPYSRDDLHGAMRQSQLDAGPKNRRTADLLAGFGSDAHADEKGVFSDTALRMVRSGDSAGQGLPAYALAIRQEITVDHLNAALFSIWSYEDDGFSLRWDPVEDQRYALRWYDPSSQSSKKHGLRTMRGANALALESLALLPVQPQAHGVATTGFARLERRRDFFTWPIWDARITLDTIRSLLASSELAKKIPNRIVLHARGVTEVYRCERIAPNQYYKNFTSAYPA